MWVVQNSAELQAPMLSGSDDDPSPRRPFDFIANIFKRRRDPENDEDGDQSPAAAAATTTTTTTTAATTTTTITTTTTTATTATAATTTTTTISTTATRPTPDITVHGPTGAARGAWARDPPSVVAVHELVRQDPTPPSASGGSVTSSEFLPSSSCELMTSSLEVGVGAAVGAVGVVHHTPVKSRDIGIDMEAIRLSRQDNPYLQRVADSQTTLNEEEEVAAISGGEDRAQLVSQSQEGALSLSEVHEHLIRSPPPTSLPKTLAKNVFVFPAPRTLDEEPPPPPPLPQPQPQPPAGQVEGALASRSQSLKPLVARQHEDVLDHHLRQILQTQRQLVVTRGRSGETVSVSSSSVPGSPAHTRGLARRSPHARTLSEEATVVQSVGTSSVAGGTVGVSGTGTGVTTTTASVAGTLAPVLPPGRRQHSSSDLLLNPANPPTGNATPTPPMLKPISKTKRSTGGPEAGLASTPLRLPIRYPHQPATSSPLIDIT